MDVEKLKDDIKNSVIKGMCYTYRHDFGLEKLEDDFYSSGITPEERAHIIRLMEQIYDHDVKKIVDSLADIAFSNDIDISGIIK